MTHRRNSYIFALSAVLALVTLLLVFMDTAHAGTKNQGLRTLEDDCTVTNKFIGPAGPHTKRARFTVSGDCVLTLVSYEMHGNGALADQVLYDSTTEEFSCASAPPAPTQRTASSARRVLTRLADVQEHGSFSSGGCSADLTVTVPDCRWQVDLVRGQPKPAAYYIDHQSDVLAWRVGGNGECQPPSTTSSSLPGTPTSTTSVSTTTTSDLSTPSSTSPSTTAALSSAFTSLAATGTPSTPTEELAQSGSSELGLIALFGLGLIGAGRYSVYRGHVRRGR